MSVSTDAILCYGFRLTDQEGNEEDISLDWMNPNSSGESDDNQIFEEFLNQLVDLTPPYEDFDDARYDSDHAYKTAWKDFWAGQGERRDKFGVDLVCHCSDGCSMYILAAKASVTTAIRGNPKEFGQGIQADPEWREQLRSFCQRVGIEFKEPQFILCSYFGG